MKLSSPLLALILIFAIQFASVHTQAITGTWSRFTTRSDSSSICCVPNSITFTKNSYDQGMVATYNIGSSFNQKCMTLFGSVTSATMSLSRISTDFYSGSRYSQIGFKTGYFYYDVTGSMLKIYTSSSSSSYDSCEFVSYSRTGGSSSYSSDSYYNYNTKSSSDGVTEIFFKGVIWVVLIIIAAICNCLKKMEDQGAPKNTAVAVVQPQSHVHHDHFAFNSDAYRPPSNHHNDFVAPHNNNAFSDNTAYAPSIHVHMSSSGTHIASGDAAAAYQANHYSNQHYGPQPVL